MKKKQKLGSDPFLGWIQDTREGQQDSKPVNQQTDNASCQDASKPEGQDTVKTAYQDSDLPVKQQNSKPVNQHTSIPVSQQDSKTAAGTKKATYYIRTDLIKRLKLLGVEKDRDLSDLANEAIELLIEKYRQ